MGVLLGVGAKLVGFVSSLLSSLLGYIGYIATWKAAKYAAEAKRTKDIAETKDEQLQIAGRPARHRDQLLERMRQLRRKSD